MIDKKTKKTIEKTTKQLIAFHHNHAIRTLAGFQAQTRELQYYLSAETANELQTVLAKVQEELKSSEVKVMGFGEGSIVFKD
jgi:uncharacterized protein YbgA (DUF1722 family)